MRLSVSRRGRDKEGECETHEEKDVRGKDPARLVILPSLPQPPSSPDFLYL